MTYADYTASGRSLGFIEDFIRDEVLPLYANTHTETSGTGLQTTRFREDARRIIHAAVGGGDDDVVIFCGSGATAAIHKLIDILNLRMPADLDDALRPRERRSRPAERPVVFIGPYEHHSNELPWRETIADVVVIDEDADGRDRPGACSSAQLERVRRPPAQIGSFSAASNVTGIVSDTFGISALLHRHGALSLLGLRRGGALRPDRHEPRPATGADPLAYKDAIFLSPHKFIGGPGTPGVLVAKRQLLRNRVPTVPGGGTVSYVSGGEHSYIDDPSHREEGGTPAIIESIRAGLVFQLKEAVGERRDRAARARRSSTAPSPRGRPTRTCTSSATRAPSGCPSSPSWSATASASCTTTSSSRCSTTSSASRPAAAAPAPAPTATGCSASTSHNRRRFREAIHCGCEGSQARLGPGQLQLLHLRGRLQLPPRGRAPGRRARLEAAAGLPASSPRPGSGGTTPRLPTPLSGWTSSALPTTA